MIHNEENNEYVFDNVYKDDKVEEFAQNPSSHIAYNSTFSSCPIFFAYTNKGSRSLIAQKKKSYLRKAGMQLGEVSLNCHEWGHLLRRSIVKSKR